jgi:hypothetical protein
MLFHQARNEASHTYDEQTAGELLLIKGILKSIQE